MGKNILIQAEVFLIDAGEVQCPEKLVPYLGDLPDDIAEEAPENAPSKGKGQGSALGWVFSGFLDPNPGFGSVFGRALKYDPAQC